MSSTTTSLKDDAAHVLVVDDDRRLRAWLSSYLVKNGHRVTVAATAAEARGFLDGLAFDIIVLDVMLPDINGKEVCQRVRSDASLEDVRILCISGMVEEEKIQELRLAGADDFLHKPFEIDFLVDRMCSLLQIEPAITV